MAWAMSSGSRLNTARLKMAQQYYPTSRVISSVAGFPDCFNINYVNDPSIYTYQILETLQWWHENLRPAASHHSDSLIAQFTYTATFILILLLLYPYFC